MVCSDFWKGLIDWFKDTLVAEKMIDPEDLNLIQLIDDPKEVVEAIFKHYESRPFGPLPSERENETIANAIAHQAKTLEHVIFAGFTHTPAIELSKKLISMLPSGFAKVFFSDDGSTSVEVALKMAIQYWHNQGEANKTTIIAFENANHGDTFGAMSVAERNAFNAAFGPYLFQVKRLPIPNKKNIESVKEQFNAIVKTGTVAAFIFEPLVQGAAGMLMYEAKYLDEFLVLAHENNVICIADEVMTGFGRTGENFAIGYLQNKPDIICLSKGITGGFMPLGVTVCSQKIFDAFYADDIMKTFFHGHSYTANPLACAAANASMEILLSEKCWQQIQFISSSHKAFEATIKTPWGPRYLTLGAYTMDNEMLGYFARLSPIVHTSHDALVVPVVVRSERAGLS